MIDNKLHTSIEKSIPTNIQSTSTLKSGQQIQATVANINLQKNTIILAIGNKNIPLTIINDNKSSQQQSAKLQTGQSLQLIVNKTPTQIEFKLIDSKQALKNTPHFILQTSKINTPPPLTFDSLKPLVQTEHKTLLTQLPLHQRISATVVQNTSTSLQIKLLTPQAIQLNFEPLKLPQNITQMSLQVIKTGEQPIFKILPALNSEEISRQALKTLLPQQLHSPIFFNQLMQQLPMIAESEQVSDTLKRLARNLLNNLPTKQQMGKATQLKKSFEQSGLFLEKNLSQPPTQQTPNLEGDLKLKLKQFVQALKQEAQPEKEVSAQKTLEQLALKDLQTKSEGALAKLILNQLKSLPQEDSNKQVWTVELPFLDKKQTQSVQIQIEEETYKHAQQEDQKVWSASLSITPPNLSTIHCKIAFFDGKVHTRFTSEAESTTKIIQHNLRYLAEQLEAAGLSTGNLMVKQQKVIPDLLQASEAQKPLFSIKA